MSSKIRPGQWEQRNGKVAKVQTCSSAGSFSVWGHDSNGHFCVWRQNGSLLAAKQSQYDLIKYLGLLEEDA